MPIRQGLEPQTDWLVAWMAHDEFKAIALHAHSLKRRASNLWGRIWASPLFETELATHRHPLATGVPDSASSVIRQHRYEQALAMWRSG